MANDKSTQSVSQNKCRRRKRDLPTVENCPPLPHVEGVEFRHCYKFLGYAVGSDGSVLTCWRDVAWRSKHPNITADGYRQVSIWNGAKTISKKVATLVAETFICPRPPGMEVCHNDGTRTNDIPSNLRWGTHSENIYDAVKHGEYVRVRLGANNANAKLTEDDIKTICGLHKKKTQVEIAKMFHVQQATISRVLRSHGLLSAPPRKRRSA